MAKLTRLICAFCKGKGKDPFEIMSKKATCQVCGGSGNARESNLSCLTCGGKGVI